MRKAQFASAIAIASTPINPSWKHFMKLLQKSFMYVMHPSQMLLKLE
ncbi:hypothetical protein H6F88_25090 [Oculatella sp. FACHB-28]|nr:hypothetical protein [Oculatella sp. FACHB-28]MBD2059230.1 hypothetical protein [Oculatella sp. FACHB-28]